MILKNKLFNITKLELKKYNFILNNIINIDFITFLLMDRVAPYGLTIGPS
jgi:hypothetical protein